MREPVYLYCDHCGAEAIEADRNGLFWDGDGDRCMTCGWPGWVSCDEESAYWHEAEEGCCKLDDCEECRAPAAPEPLYPRHGNSPKRQPAGSDTPVAQSARRRIA